MIGEIVTFERNDKRYKAMVFCYMPCGGPEMTNPYLKAYLLEHGVVHHNNIHLVRLDDPTLEVLTLDREVGHKMEEQYVSTSTDPESYN